MAKLVSADLTGDKLCTLTYTTTDGKMLSLKEDDFDAKIISHFYSNKGVIIFEKPITLIGWKAFLNCDSLTNVEIGSSVTEIGWRAFEGCTSLTSITIPDSVTSIGGGAFFGCTSLKSVHYTGVLSAWCKIDFEHYNAVPQGAKLYINEVELTDITIPSDITEIKNYAFCGCASLKSITIPDSVTSIGKAAFYDCTSLTSITIPDSVTSIGYAAFSGCTSLPVIDGVRYADTYLVEVVDKTRTSYSIRPSIRFFGNSAFRDCSSLTNLTIGNSVISIGQWAFFNCSSLTIVTIPDSVTEIGREVFSGCTSLPVIDGVRYAGSHLVEVVDKTRTSYFIKPGTRFLHNLAFRDCRNLISVTIPDSVVSIGYGVFDGCISLTRATISNRLTKIEETTFNGCSNLKGITIPSSVTSIGHSAFYNCSCLTSVTISNSVTLIADYAFSGCDNLTGIIIPDSVTSIGNSAFYGCRSLTGVTIGNSVAWIGNDAYRACLSLKTIICKAEIPPKLGSNAFSEFDTLIVPEGCEDAYLNSDWRKYIVEEEESDTE